MRRDFVIVVTVVVVAAAAGVSAERIAGQGPGPGTSQAVPPQGRQPQAGPPQGPPPQGAPGQGTPPQGGAPPVMGQGGPGQRGQMGPGGPGRQGPGMPMAPNGGAPPFARQIDLSNEQREKVGDILLTMRDQSAQMADELQLARRTLHREAFADKRDEKKVADITAKIVAFEKQLLDIHVKSQAAISDTLTPKQREMVRTSGNAFGGPGGPGTPGGPAGRGGGVQR